MNTGFTRRTLLIGSGGLAAAVMLGGQPAAADLPTLEPFPPGQPQRSAFEPAEQRYAGYAAILAPMVNDIAGDGFMDGDWWRRPDARFNARKQEQVYTLAWFYANDRPWNPYYRNPTLLAQLDVALQYYLGLQHITDGEGGGRDPVVRHGTWPEYRPTEVSRAATAFALRFLAPTLSIMRECDVLPQRQQELKVALHSAMSWFLQPDSLKSGPERPEPIWDEYVSGTNQAAAGLAGAVHALALDPDQILEGRLLDRIEYLAERGQAAPGYFYDKLGWDHGYNFGVMLPELADIYLHTKNQTILAMVERFSEWFQYTMLREPDGSGWLTYVAASGRTNNRSVDDVEREPYKAVFGSHFVPEVPSLGAFFTSAEDMRAMREQWRVDPDPVPALEGPAGTSPRVIYHGTYGDRFPSASEKVAAISQLPYLRETDFVELRRDSAHDRDFLFVRRPSFYLGAHFGVRDSERVRTGPGFLWHPDAGTLVASQRSVSQSWGTVRNDGSSDADGDLVVDHYHVGGRELTGSVSHSGNAAVRVRYRTAVGTPAVGRVVTNVVVSATSLLRRVDAGGPATEQIPLVVHPDDEMFFGDGIPVNYGTESHAESRKFTLRRNSTAITIEWEVVRPASLSATSTTFLRDQRRQLHVLRVAHLGHLSTTIAELR